MHRARLGGVSVLAAVSAIGSWWPAAAHGHLTVNSSEFSPGHHAIFVLGDAENDALQITTLAPVDGDRVFRLSPAQVTGGTQCTQDGAAAICNDDASAGPGGDYFLQVALGAGNDTLIQNGPIGGLFAGEDGNDHLVSAPTAAVASQLSGGAGDDAYLVGDSFGPDVVSDLSGRDFVDYRDRGPGELGGNVTVDTDGVADDGGAAEGDNIGTTIEAVRGTRQAGDTLSASIVDGDLGADSITATTLVFDTTTNNSNPERTAGVTVDLRTMTDSDGDTLFGVANVVGTHLDDTIFGDDLHNTIHGRASGGEGDAVFAGGGNDRVNDPGSPVRVGIFPQTGNGKGKLVANGNDGDDFIQAFDSRGFGSSHIAGASGQDVLLGGPGDDFINAGGGDLNNGGTALGDRVEGGGGLDGVGYLDAVEGVRAALGTDAAASPVAANSQGDTIMGIEDLLGTDHGDVLTGNDGPNGISGSGGDDVIDPGDRAGGAQAREEDFVTGGFGVDTVDYSRHEDGFPASGSVIDLSGQRARSLTDPARPEDRLEGVENAIGTPRSDWLVGSDQANRLDGGGGADLLQGQGGADALAGGAGEDLVTYAERTSGITLSLAAGGARPDGDTFEAVEGACGTQGADGLTGGDGADRLLGLGGNDTLTGGVGADALGGELLTAVPASLHAACGGATPAAGLDVLLGGAGADRLEGGGSTDVVSYAGEIVAVRAALATPVFPLDNSHGDLIAADVEGLVGGSAGDILAGNAGANSINGGPGNDQIDGGAGNDSLQGGDGADTIAPFTNTGTAASPTLARERAPADDGLDTVGGGAGNDELDTRDARFDSALTCGSGTDTAVIDLKDAGSQRDCETQQRAEIDVHPLPRLRAVRRTPRRLAARVVCPRVRTRKIGRFCRGTARVRAGRRTLGRAGFRVRQGRSRRLAIRLRRPARRGAVVELVEVQRNGRKRTTTVRLR